MYLEGFAKYGREGRPILFQIQIHGPKSHTLRARAPLYSGPSGYELAIPDLDSNYFSGISQAKICLKTDLLLLLHWFFYK